VTQDGQTPEQFARVNIDVALVASGWIVQDVSQVNLAAARGVAVREFQMASGPVDYLLLVDHKAVGVLEAKPEGHPLGGVELQARRYGEGLPDTIDTPIRPLPFQYLSTGVKTKFTNLLDPEPRSRFLFQIHRPETLADFLAADSLAEWLGGQNIERVADAAVTLDQPSSLRGRIRAMPPLNIGNLWPNKIKAITNLERSLSEDRPRALIQMATGSGKTLTAITRCGCTTCARTGTSR